MMFSSSELSNTKIHFLLSFSAEVISMCFITT